MFGTKKHKGLIWSVIISSLLLLPSCTAEPKVQTISGNAQGTTYQITLVGEDTDAVDPKQITTLLQAVDQALSTYVPQSVISRINACTDSITLIDTSGYFKRCYELSQQVFQETDGAFDPSVYPLVAGWGFMKNLGTPLSQAQVDSILPFIGFERGKLHEIVFSGDTIRFFKKVPGFKLDFNAIAQGLTVDLISEYLEKTQHDYYIELGGEVLVKGKNKEGDRWRIGIDAPVDNANARSLDTIVHVSNQAIATSGNYRKFYIKDGVKYAHTLDPATGFPVTHKLLSASVVAPNCALADAYATAFMVMGKTRAMQFVSKHPEVAVYLISSGENGAYERTSSASFRPLWE